MEALDGAGDEGVVLLAGVSAEGAEAVLETSELLLLLLVEEVLEDVSEDVFEDVSEDVLEAVLEADELLLLLEDELDEEEEELPRMTTSKASM